MLRERRLAQGLTQQQLSERTSVDSKQIGDYENNRYIMKVSTAKVFADLLHCSIEDLYEWHYD
ncbi:helix-turn-helix transcriptional regulator [Cytobacillus gottheilii]|uniref:Helix-turn-helix transcriptional regulator n=1 Tax=Cytobacillus gottheilii TaxID=859144 RepID=A0ABX8FG19_9BACI|nr:helix-turn-helix transcriptional regulator [Cytobacillus gottheilii]